MPKLVPIVEGVGETTAVPVLLYKVLASLNRYDIQVASPKNAHGRDNLTKAGGLERFLALAAMERDCGAVMVLLDVEEGCALSLVKEFVARIERHYVKRPVVIVAANRMYENWILASLETVRGNDLEGRPVCLWTRRAQVTRKRKTAKCI